MKKIFFVMGKRKGMTLVELLVAMFIFSLGMIGVVLLFLSTWKTNSYILEEGDAIAAASNALNETIKEIRKIRQADDGSYAIKSVGEFDLVVYLDDDGDDRAERLHYFLDDAGNFKKGITQSDGAPYAYPSEDQEIVTIAQYVMNTSSEPIFTFYDNLYPVETINNPLINPQPSDVRLIGLHLWINIKPKTAPDNINLESFAKLRNLNENK